MQRKCPFAQIVYSRPAALSLLVLSHPNVLLKLELWLSARLYRYPGLLTCCFYFALRWCSKEPVFQKYFPPASAELLECLAPRVLRQPLPESVPKAEQKRPGSAGAAAAAAAPAGAAQQQQERRESSSGGSGVASKEAEGGAVPSPPRPSSRRESESEGRASAPHAQAQPQQAAKLQQPGPAQPQQGQAAKQDPPPPQQPQRQAQGKENGAAQLGLAWQAGAGLASAPAGQQAELASPGKGLAAGAAGGLGSSIWATPPPSLRSSAGGGLPSPTSQPLASPSMDSRQLQQQHGAAAGSGMAAAVAGTGVGGGAGATSPQSPGSLRRISVQRGSPGGGGTHGNTPPDGTAPTGLASTPEASPPQTLMAPTQEQPSTPLGPWSPLGLNLPASPLIGGTPKVTGGWEPTLPARESPLTQRPSSLSEQEGSLPADPTVLLPPDLISTLSPGPTPTSLVFGAGSSGGAAPFVGQQQQLQQQQGQGQAGGYPTPGGGARRDRGVSKLEPQLPDHDISPGALPWPALLLCCCCCCKVGAATAAVSC